MESQTSRDFANAAPELASRGERSQPRSAMLNTFLVCSGFSPTSAALRPAHAPFAAATPRSIPATMLAKRRASGGGKVEVAYTVLEEDGSDVWRADDAVAVIRSGGVGVIPTDTGYDDARVQSHVSCGLPAGGAAARLRTALSLATLPRPQVLVHHGGVFEAGRQSDSEAQGREQRPEAALSLVPRPRHHPGVRPRHR